MRGREAWTCPRSEQSAQGCPRGDGSGTVAGATGRGVARAAGGDASVSAGLSLAADAAAGGARRGGGLRRVEVARRRRGGGGAGRRREGGGRTGGLVRGRHREGAGERCRGRLRGGGTGVRSTAHREEDERGDQVTRAPGGRSLCAVCGAAEGGETGHCRPYRWPPAGPSTARSGAEPRRALAVTGRRETTSGSIAAPSGTGCTCAAGSNSGPPAVTERTRRPSRVRGACGGLQRPSSRCPRTRRRGA